jgi:hypothetical protein
MLVRYKQPIFGVCSTRKKTAILNIELSTMVAGQLIHILDGLPELAFLFQN